ncbi:MAG: hypothetical protein MUD10_04880 [Candidatus Pacebacteria bacterium]|jgi:hypothetical protein|nr:hypothetical protein [Candidatus Paceibacterota bacterium]
MNNYCENSGGEAGFDEPAVLININKIYKPEMEGEELYEATRKPWVIDVDRANKIKIACAVFQGIIKEVYFADRWRICPEGERYCFEGSVASDAMRQKYIGKSVKSYWPVGDQTPIKYADYEVSGVKYKS